MSSSRRRVFVSNRAYLPSGPSPASIEVEDGTILKIHSQRLSRDSFPGLDSDEDYIDTGDAWLLPGVSPFEVFVWQQRWILSLFGYRGDGASHLNSTRHHIT